MRIAINTRFLLSSKMEGFGWYTYEVTKRLVEAHPEHTFILFFDRPYHERFVFGPNVIPVVLFPPARHPFLFIWWFEWAITRALKKYQADVFFSPDGYLSLRSKVPQVGVIHDLNFEHHPQDVPMVPRWYLKYFFPRFAKKAKALLSVSHYSKADIAKTYSIPEDKITVAWNGAAEAYHPMESNAQVAFRKEHTNGRFYFIYVGAIHPRKNVPNLLRAFSQFCAGNNDIDLVIVGAQMWKNALTELPELSNEVLQRIHFKGHLTLRELTEWMGAAKALVYVPYFEGFGIPLVEAMQSGIPIIAANRTALPEVAGDAALYVDPFDLHAIAQAMHQLADDEGLYAELREKGLKRSKGFSWDKTAEQVWEVIADTVAYIE